MVICTNVLMPLFSDDNAKRFMVENFGQYLEENALSLGVLGKALRPAPAAAEGVDLTHRDRPFCICWGTACRWIHPCSAWIPGCWRA